MVTDLHQCCGVERGGRLRAAREERLRRQAREIQEFRLLTRISLVGRLLIEVCSQALLHARSPSRAQPCRSSSITFFEDLALATIHVAHHVLDGSLQGGSLGGATEPAALRPGHVNRVAMSQLGIMCLAQLFKSHDQAQLYRLRAGRQLQTVAQAFDGCLLLQGRPLIGARLMRREQKFDRRVPLAAADAGSRQELQCFGIGRLAFEQEPT